MIAVWTAAAFCSQSWHWIIVLHLKIFGKIVCLCVSLSVETNNDKLSLLLYEVLVTRYDDLTCA